MNHFTNTMLSRRSIEATIDIGVSIATRIANAQRAKFFLYDRRRRRFMRHDSGDNGNTANEA